MILYKYVGFSAACKIIETSTLGFSRVLDLNDPFECTCVKLLENKGMTDNLVVNAIKEHLAPKFGVLSLTRQPLNSLMWAHYGQSHTGVVIGIDCEKAGLMDVESSLVPAQFGDVIYTATKPEHPISGDVFDQLYLGGTSLEFEPHSHNLLSRAFLHKSLEWGYEEEVRVIKDIRESSGVSVSKRKTHSYANSSGDWNQLLVDNRPISCLSVPREAFTKVYIGRHAYKNVTQYGTYSHDEFCGILQGWADVGIEVHGCTPDVSSWNLVSQRLEKYS